MQAFSAVVAGNGPALPRPELEPTFGERDGRALAPAGYRPQYLSKPCSIVSQEDIVARQLPDSRYTHIAESSNKSPRNRRGPVQTAAINDTAKATGRGRKRSPGGRGRWRTQTADPRRAAGRAGARRAGRG